MILCIKGADTDMAIQKIDDDKLLDRLTRVFRLYGFEGASLSRISKVTGLGRASLYHRFPGGKDEMAKAVLAHAGRWMTYGIKAPLSGPGTPPQRIRLMADRLHEFYSGGRQSCLLDSLSFSAEDNEIRKHIKRGMTAWARALAAVAREAGLPAKRAQQRAEDAIVRIQGALVVARAMGDTGPFERTLRELPQVILGQKHGNA